MMSENVEDVLANVQAQIEATRNGEQVTEESAPAEEESYEIEYEGGDAEHSIEIEAESEVEAEDALDLDSDEQKALDLGWTPFDEYVEAGGDPSMYRGAKAFLQYKEQIDKHKGKADEANEKVTHLESEMKKMNRMFLEQLKAQKAKAKQDLERQLREAKENLDVDRVADLSNELNSYSDDIDIDPEDEPEAPSVTQEQQQPLITLINENPVIDRSSDEFDPDVAAMLSVRLDRRFAGMDQSQMTPERIQAVVNQEWDATQKRLGLKKQRQVRKAPNTTAQQPKGKVANGKVRMTKDEKQMYDYFIRMGDKETAKEYAKTIQERG